MAKKEVKKPDHRSTITFESHQGEPVKINITDVAEDGSIQFDVEGSMEKAKGGFHGVLFSLVEDILQSAKFMRMSSEDIAKAEAGQAEAGLQGNLFDRPTAEA